MRPIRIVLADDHPLFLEGLQAILADNEDVRVVGVTTSGRKLAQLVREAKPHLVLLDLAMPGIDGLKNLATLRSRFPDVKVAILSADTDGRTIATALRQGASAYIVKTINAHDIAAVARHIVDGTVYQSVGEAAQEERDDFGLTERELAVLRGVARGLSNEQIAKSLWITRQTVKYHTRNVFRKLGVANRTEAARHAYEYGLVGDIGDADPVTLP